MQSLTTNVYNGVAYGCNQTYALASTVGSTVSSVAQACLDLVPFLPMNPVTRHREIHLIPEFALNAYAKGMYDTSIKLESIDNKDSELINTIGQTIARQSDRTDFNFEFVLVNQKDSFGKPVVNAFCLPGGKIAITNGLLQKLRTETIESPMYEGFDLNTLSLENKIAAVLSHEITHACANHSISKVSFGLVVYVIGKIVNFVTLNHFINKEKEKDVEKNKQVKKNAEAMGWLAEKTFTFGTFFYTQRHSQKCEFEADTVGMSYAQKAGFDPRASIWLQEMFVKMHKEHSLHIEGTSFLGKIARFFTVTNEMLSSHPPSAQRVDMCKHKWEELNKQNRC